MLRETWCLHSDNCESSFRAENAVALHFHCTPLHQLYILATVTDFPSNKKRIVSPGLKGSHGGLAGASRKTKSSASPGSVVTRQLARPCAWHKYWWRHSNAPRDRVIFHVKTSVLLLHPLRPNANIRRLRLARTRYGSTPQRAPEHGIRYAGVTRGSSSSPETVITRTASKNLELKWSLDPNVHTRTG